MTDGVPDFVARAMRAQGKITPEEVAERLQESPDQAAHPPGGLVCATCHGEANPADGGTLREIVGWSRDREQGGQNHVIMRKETGRLMCRVCAAHVRAGLPVGQESLLG